VASRNSFDSLAIAYLSSLLVHSLRRKSSELEETREELWRQDFPSDIIHSPASAAVTTDMEGRVCANRTGEEGGGGGGNRGELLCGIAGRDCAKEAEFWQHGESQRFGRSFPLRREIEVRIPGGPKRGTWEFQLSPLRTASLRADAFEGKPERPAPVDKTHRCVRIAWVRTFFLRSGTRKAGDLQ